MGWGPKEMVGGGVGGIMTTGRSVVNVLKGWLLTERSVNNRRGGVHKSGGTTGSTAGTMRGDVTRLRFIRSGIREHGKWDRNAGSTT